MERWLLHEYTEIVSMGVNLDLSALRNVPL